MTDRTSRIPRWAWGFLALLGLAIASLVFFLVSGNSSDKATPRPMSSASSSPTMSPTSDVADPDASICGLAAGDQTIPEEAPETTWELVNGYAVPTSDKFGPGIHTNTELKCFAHNPTGALFAAARVTSFAFSADDRAKQFISDPNQINFGSEGLRQKALDSAGSTNSDSNSLQIAGFKIQQNSPDNVIAYLAFDAEVDDRRGLMILPFEMQWANGDWAYKAPAYQQHARQIPSLVSENYIPWSGVN